VTAVYQPAAGLLVLAPAALAAAIDHLRGGRPDDAAIRPLVEAGLVVDDQLDPPLVPLVSALTGNGARLRVLSRMRGRLTVTDAATGQDPGRNSGPGQGAAIVVRPPGADVLHLQHTTTGTLARFLARTIGLGAHVGAEPPDPRLLELRDWSIVRSGFDTPEPSGWVGRRQHAALHEVRWAPSPATPARTALVVAQLDGGLAEIRPSSTLAGAFTVTGADTGSAWRRLCVLTTPSSPDGPPDTSDAAR
jgi:hypothetical protein